MTRQNKKLVEEVETKAARREQKKRVHMKVSGRSVLRLKRILESPQRKKRRKKK
ncbi:MAG: hypothetical protein Q8Q20_03485 [bacterium]|nr:hypothetical protein [bacterium]